MGYSDSHAHLVDYPADQLKKLFELMRMKDVELVLNVSVNLDVSEKSIRLAEANKDFITAVGIHPWFAEAPGSDIRKRFKELASSKYVKAVGEIGLDYMPPVTPPDSEIEVKDGAPQMPTLPGMPKLPETPPTPEVQKELFKFELSEAVKNNLPVNVHCRGGAHRDMMDILRKEVKSGLTGMAHEFEGGMREVREWLDLDFYIAFGNMNVITEPLPGLAEIVRAVPIDRILTQTDANPMMSPVNGPTDVIEVVRIIASITGTTVEKISNNATANLRRVLKL